MKKLDLTCPHCAATMTVDENKQKLTCKYCDSEIILERKETAEEIREKQEAKAYGYHRGKLLAKEEAETRQRKKSIKAKIIGVFIFITILGITFFFMKASMPSVNPFEYLEVAFTGEDGRGEATLVFLPVEASNIDIGNVHFECSRDSFLCEGEEITITAESDDYNLTETSRKYTVTGLDLFLTDVTILTEDHLKTLASLNEAEQLVNFEAFVEENIEVTITPIKLILSAGNQENRLYEISETTTYVDGKPQTIYTVCYWDNVILRNNQINSIDTGSTFHTGDLLDLAFLMNVWGYKQLDSATNVIYGDTEGHMTITELDLQ